MATRHYCDHCDVELPEAKHAAAHIYWREPQSKTREQKHDLCPTCLGMLLQLLHKDQWVREPA